MRREEEQLLLAKGVWCDSYRFYLKYHGQMATPDMWKAAVEDNKVILEKYKYSLVCIRIMMAALSLLEEETR